MNEHEIVVVVKTFFINIFIYTTFLKLINKKINMNILVTFIIMSILNAIVYSIFDTHASHMFIIFLMYFMQCLFLRLIIRENEKPILLTNLIANSIVYILFILSSIFEIIFKILIDMSPVINLILILAIESAFLILLLRTKRLKNGLSFLKNKKKYDYIDMIMINISSIIILVYCLFGINNKKSITNLIIVCIIMGGVLFFLIQKMLTLYYKQKLLKQTIEDYKLEIDLKDEKIKALAEEKYNISKVNHEFYNRQRALEMKVSNLINSSNFNMEASEDIAIIEGIKNLTKEYSEKMEDIKFLEILPSSDIEDIDDMFKYMQAECKKNNIEFNVKINGNIHYMINNLIKVNKLVTLIGDHIRDAIIAVNSSDNEYRNILAILGVKDNIYEFCVYDSGIEFEIDTLLKLGTEPITTHSKTGGTGIGFMTTFETMKETKASLIIKELGKPNVSNYTKCVTVRLDGKNNYTIDSYRKDEIRMKNINNRDINIK